jgi:predicted MFS family arabinose efflux permease
MTGDAVRNYAIVTAAYWGFTLTDGALRMLVLLHFFTLGFAPLTLAALFLLYEAAGVLANLLGGWLALRVGIARMLVVGLALQIVGLLALSAVDPGWSIAMSVAWVAGAQGLCGIAKDLTKTASKSAIKLTAGDTPGRLFAWVAWFTGSKNAMKGAGFFLGGALLGAVGFRSALWIMAGGLAMVAIAAAGTLPPLLGRASASRTARELLARSRAVNLLAAARICLFGARDAWFVIALPLFLQAAGWGFAAIGATLALWTIFYGTVQAATPALARVGEGGTARAVDAARFWGAILAMLPAGMALAIPGDAASAAPLVLAGFFGFGAVFAVNSSLHSYLILAYAGSRKAAEDVGFYYAANATGRFLGTLASGAFHGWGGMRACLWAAAIALALAWAVSLLLPRDQAREGA